MCTHAAMKGVCDTPLHLFDKFMGNMMVERFAFSPPWRAYAIRPYTFSFISRGTQCLNGWRQNDGGEHATLVGCASSPPCGAYDGASYDFGVMLWNDYSLSIRSWRYLRVLVR